MEGFICLSVFSFWDDDLSKYQWIFTKLSVCIDIVEIWFGIDRVIFSSYNSGLVLSFHFFIFQVLVSASQKKLD